MSFQDRSEAGRRLAARLAHYKGEPVTVYALPRGGVPVAAPIAATLHAPLDLVLVRKLGTPLQPELAMGAIADGGSPIVVRNDEVIEMAGVSEADLRRRLPTRTSGNRTTTTFVLRRSAAPRVQGTRGDCRRRRRRDRSDDARGAAGDPRARAQEARPCDACCAA